MKSFSTAAALAGCAILALLATGCGGTGGKNLTHLQGWADFQKQVLQSNRPVLVEISKEPCPTCVVQASELDKLYDEYSDRVGFAHIIIVNGTWTCLVPEVRDRYKIFWVPTTLLFIKGEEKKRWELNHSADEIRQALKEVVGPPTGPKAPVGPKLSSGKP